MAIYRNSSVGLRGTKKFLVQVYTETHSWETILRGRLTSAIDLGCDAPLETFSLSSVRREHLVRLKVLSVYGVGGGIKFIDFLFETSSSKQRKGHYITLWCQNSPLSPYSVN